MRAICWHGKNDVRLETVNDPQILNPRDCIVKVRNSAISETDLRAFEGSLPDIERGGILGHELTGEVVEVGLGVKSIKTGDRVVVPYSIACGACHYCRRELFSLCDNSNPKARLLEKKHGQSMAGVLGSPRSLGGYAGTHAEYVRVPFSDVGPVVLPDEIDDDTAIFLSEALPTGFYAAEICQIQPGDTVAIWGAGPIGLFAARSARLLGASRVIMVESDSVRRQVAQSGSTVEVFDPGHRRPDDAPFDDIDELILKTGGRGADACIVSTFSDGLSGQPNRDFAEAVRAARKGAVVAVPGVLANGLEGSMLTSAFAKGITLRLGPCHPHAYMRSLLKLIASGDFDPTFAISHRIKLDEVPQMYRSISTGSCSPIKVVINSTL